jgi:CubicO group peptidase (beta-lactamase class C family)
MRQRVLWSLAYGALFALAAVSSGRTDGTFDLPPGAHFDRAKLDRVGDYLRDQVANGKIPGAVLLIQQHGKPVYHEFFGVRDVATELPMSDDTIFRIFSMTKPITSVVAVMLIAEGKFKLDDPVSKYIPSFANVKVGVEKLAEDGKKTLELVPPDRPPTILDLMRQTSGITYAFYGDSLVRKAYRAANIYAGDFDNAEFAERIAKLPLQNQPGALWQYGHSTDVLGRIMEIVTGKSLLDIEREKLLDPLGMNETRFYVADPGKKQLIARPMPSDSNYRVGFESTPEIPMKWESGGGGMVSTMSDLARFSQMILNGGKFDGTQYLSPKSFELMTTDHVGADSVVGRDLLYFPGDGFGFGLGFAVRTDPGTAKPPPAGSLGELKWDGASGCYFVIDRKQDMFFVLLEQTPSERQRIQPAVKRLIYEAMEN